MAGSSARCRAFRHSKIMQIARGGSSVKPRSDHASIGGTLCVPSLTFSADIAPRSLGECRGGVARQRPGAPEIDRPVDAASKGAHEAVGRLARDKVGIGV